MNVSSDLRSLGRPLAGLTLAVALSACGYEAPVDPGADPVLNGVSGTIVLGIDTPPDDVLVFLYDAADPPPPVGFGRPVTFGTVPAGTFSDDGAGMRSAPFALTEVPDGTYLVTAVMDVDDDFFPLITANAGATCGDWRGAHLTDLVTQEVAPVVLNGGRQTDGITVVLAAEYTTERPAFLYTDNAVELGFLLESTLDPARLPDLDFDLQSTGINSDLIEIAGPDEATAECVTGFMVVVEGDAEGNPAPHWVYGEVDVPAGNAAGAYLKANAFAVWPRVVATYTGVGDVALEPGELYISEAAHDPDTVRGEWPVNTPFPVASLNMTFVPGVQHILPDGSVEVLLDAAAVPTGEWALTVISPSGQTWTVPNEIAGYPAASPDYDPQPQGARLQVSL
jgi:hypothetical protein